MQYFIKRNEKINGPFTDVQVKAGFSAGKLKETDMISNSEEGPWKTLGMLNTSASGQQQEGQTNEVAEKIVGGATDLVKGMAQAIRKGVQDGVKQHEQRTAAPGPPPQSETGSSSAVALKAIAVKEVSVLELLCECDYETAFNVVRLAAINSGGYVHDSVPISGRLSIAFPGKTIPIVVNIQQEDRLTSIKVEKVLFIFWWNRLKGKAIAAEIKSILSNPSVLERLASPEYVGQLTRKERGSKNLQAAKKVGTLVGLAVMAPCLIWALFAILIVVLWFVLSAGALSLFPF
tara:strand:- start:193 stop:1062 length:870 start_codon:yes stop_codon:yes gene_type:complete